MAALPIEMPNGKESTTSSKHQGRAEDVLLSIEVRKRTATSLLVNSDLSYFDDIDLGCGSPSARKAELLARRAIRLLETELTEAILRFRDKGGDIHDFLHIVHRHDSLASFDRGRDSSFASDRNFASPRTLRDLPRVDYKPRYSQRSGRPLRRTETRLEQLRLPRSSIGKGAEGILNHGRLKRKKQVECNQNAQRQRRMSPEVVINLCSNSSNFSTTLETTQDSLTCLLPVSVKGTSTETRSSSQGSRKRRHPRLAISPSFSDSGLLDDQDRLNERKSSATVTGDRSGSLTQPDGDMSVEEYAETFQDKLRTDIQSAITSPPSRQPSLRNAEKCFASTEPDVCKGGTRQLEEVDEQEVLRSIDNLIGAVSQSFCGVSSPSMGIKSIEPLDWHDSDIEEVQMARELRSDGWREAGVQASEGKCESAPFHGQSDHHGYSGYAFQSDQREVNAKAALAWFDKHGGIP